MKIKQIALCMLLNIPAVLFAQKSVIIPQPVILQYTQNNFVIDNNTTLRFNKTDKALQEGATFFKAAIKSISGVELAINTPKNKSIELKLNSNAALNDEEYELSVTPAMVIISANKRAGII